MVVDNASQDGTVAHVQSHYPQVTVLANEENLGFGRANNRALAKITTPYALLLNPDAELTPQDVQRLIEKAKIYRNAAIICPLQQEEGRILKSFRLRQHVFARNRAPFTPPEGDCATELASGAVMLWNMAHVHNVGFFDPEIFLFFEDDDICLRVREAGYSTIITPDVVAHHPQGSASKPSLKGTYLRNLHYAYAECYFGRKHSLASHLLPWQRILKHSLKALGYVFSGNTHKATRAWGRLCGSWRYLMRSS